MLTETFDQGELATLRWGVDKVLQDLAVRELDGEDVTIQLDVAQRVRKKLTGVETMVAELEPVSGKPPKRTGFLRRSFGR